MLVFFCCYFFPNKTVTLVTRVESQFQPCVDGGQAPFAIANSIKVSQLWVCETLFKAGDHEKKEKTLHDASADTERIKTCFP